MQAPRRNIELKATDPDPFTSLDVCRRLGAEDCGTIEQRDTYFEVAPDDVSKFHIRSLVR